MSYRGFKSHEDWERSYMRANFWGPLSVLAMIVLGVLLSCGLSIYFTPPGPGPNEAQP